MFASWQRIWVTAAVLISLVAIENSLLYTMVEHRWGDCFILFGKSAVGVTVASVAGAAVAALISVGFRQLATKRSF